MPGMSGFGLSDRFHGFLDGTDERRMPTLAFALLFFVYCLTSAPGIGWFDSGEWAFVIESWGLGHPPGSPGYILSAGAFAHLLPINFDRALVIFSALCAALTLFPLDRILRCLGQSSSLIRFGWLLLGGLLPNVWLQAVRIELYSLSTLLLFIIVARCLARRTTLERDWVTVFIAGLLLSVNALFGLMALLVFVVTVLVQDRRTSMRSILTKAIGWCMAGTLGLLPFVYCFVVSSYEDRFIWGDWHSLPSILFYFSGQDYAVNWAGEPDRWANLSSFFGYWWQEGTLLIMVVGLVMGLRLMIASATWLITIFGTLFLAFFVVSNRLFYPEVPDYHGYLMPLYWICIVGVAAGLHQISTRAQSLVFAGLALVSSFSSARQMSARDFSAQVLPYALVEDILKTAAPNAILVLSSDHLVFPLMYVQMKGARSDLVIFNEGFANSGWYWRFLGDQHTGLSVPPLNRPMKRDDRIRAFLAAEQARPIYFESPVDANRLGVMTCAGEPFAVAAKICKDLPHASQVERLDRYWSLTPAHLNISRKVIAKLSEDAAVTRLQRGDFAGGLSLLRFGVDPEQRPGPCKIGGQNFRPTPPRLSATLIGDSDRNLAHFRSLCDQFSGSAD